MKKMLEKYDDDFCLSFGDYEFQRLYKKHDTEVEVKLIPIIDHIVSFEDREREK
ncbi:MAG: hypothetical protein GQ549_07790 [Gammaproteobacteria bacterium]|nr:hypothetical protein [Gammaproteobacteria bacterium]